MGERVEKILADLAAAVREEIGALPDNILTLAEELAAARKVARMSLQEVGDKAGCTKSHVWEIEQGRACNPTVETVAGLARALGVPFLRLAQAALNGTTRKRHAALHPEPLGEGGGL